MFRFRLRWLLAGVGIAACVLMFWTQAALRTATFEIRENKLAETSSGLVSGTLVCSYSGPEAKGREFVFEVVNLDKPKLLSLQRGDDFRIRFQYEPLWPIEKENQYLAFVQNCLGVEQEYLDGFVMMPDQTRVVLRGR